jgi:RNA polymerase sigma-70 factor (ECF subfamily)
MVQGTDLAELVGAAAAGDLTAQSTLVASYESLARSTARRLVDDSHSADDVVQDAFLEVFSTLHQLRRPEAFPAWVRLAVRKHADRHRRRQRRTDTLSGAPEPSSAAADEGIDRQAIVTQVRTALATIRDSDRRLLELRYLADWSIAELAGALDLSEGAVRKRLHDVRNRIRPNLEGLTQRRDTRMTDYEALLGHIHRPGEIDLDAAPAVARPATREPIATGLKILDTIAPIARGGTVEMVGPAGTGHLVLLVELSYRLNRTTREAAVVAVASSLTSAGARSNLGKLVTELAEHDRHAVFLSDDDEGASRALRDGANLARGLANAAIDVLLVVDKATANAVGGPVVLKDLAGASPGGGSITMILLDAYARDADLPADAGLETRLVFSAENLSLGIFPALDPIASRAAFDNSEVAEEVRALLRTSLAVRRYFNQPMLVAEVHTGEPPTWVDRSDAEQELRTLLGTHA